MLLVDGDIVVYSVAHACESRYYEVQDPDIGLSNVYRSKTAVRSAIPGFDTRELVPIITCAGERAAEDITRRCFRSWQDKTDKREVVVYLTNRDINCNFRKKLYPEYKRNREGLVKPRLYEFMRYLLMKKYGAEVVSGYEADDALGIAQNEKTIIVSKDKDLLQVPGLHYNITKSTITKSTKIGGLKLWRDKAGKARLIGHGFKFFCAQMLLGDPVDNIKGIHRCGPVATFKYLSKCNSKRKLWGIIEDVYESHNRDDVLINAQLLWILREEGCYFDKAKI